MGIDKLDVRLVVHFDIPGSVVVRPAEIQRICAHLGYPTEPPLIAPARAPPQAELWDQRLAG